MKRLLFAAALCLCPVCPVIVHAQVGDDDIMMRGDANQDGSVNHSDGIFIRNYLISSGPEPDCLNQADANDDGQVTLSDATYIWTWLYNGGSAPPPPGPYATECSQDPTPSSLSCYYLSC